MSSERLTGQRHSHRRSYHKQLRLLRWRYLIFTLTGFAQLVDASYHERRLYEDLMRDYNNLERPVSNHSDPVTVYLKVSLQQLIDVDEKNQVVFVNAWLDYTWQDVNLRQVFQLGSIKRTDLMLPSQSTFDEFRWDKAEYGNITDIRFPAGRIWKPDVLLYNSVDANFDSTYPTNMVVYSTGDVSWIPPGIFKISCKIDIKWFPFDEQRCFFKFGSWSYNGFKLDLQPAKGGFDISEYLPNGEWALPMTTVARSEKFYDCCPNEPYPDVTFYLHMRRRTLYYGFNLIMPCILTTTMTLLGFTLPPDAGEKITLQITVLLSICFFLSMLSEMSPPTSEAVPLLGIFFSSCMIIVTASTVFTVYVLNLHYRTPETHEMTPMARTILLYWLPYLLRIERPGVYLSWEALPSILPFSKPKKHSESLIRNIKQVEDGSRGSIDLERHIHQYITGISNGGMAASLKTVRNVSSTQHSIESTQISASPISDTITKRMQEEEREESQANSWKFAAMVVDRLCLYVFTIFIIATILGVMLAAPYLVA